MILWAFAEQGPQPGPEQRRLWLAASRASTVIEQCGCGICPSMRFSSTEGGSQTVLGAHDTAQHAMVLLHLHADELIELEVAPVRDEPIHMPSPEHLSFR
ncbi:hypothetical protein [Corynebacterium lowii]|uniref:Uncharacterized protein n=1 Tax=Corynebacterium lowii TaxID=1544413 RepID=A0A0Q0UJF2_9CORY|nr:hypothetical protein [Corynebacterium lowii]KQB86349.1 hypothetical protein Clow_01269 [Corynebacterium lowii]MDP9850834.1 hypothetical protein [Corynebacterium lowii]